MYENVETQYDTPFTCRPKDMGLHKIQQLFADD